jgi:hypothetical protein
MDIKKTLVRLIYAGWVLLLILLVCMIDKFNIFSHDFTKKAGPLVFAGIFFLNYLYSVTTGEVYARGISINKTENPGWYYFITYFCLLLAVGEVAIFIF